MLMDCGIVWVEEKWEQVFTFFHCLKNICRALSRITVKNTVPSNQHNVPPVVHFVCFKNFYTLLPSCGKKWKLHLLHVSCEKN